MKDAKGHGSNPHGSIPPKFMNPRTPAAHQMGVEAIRKAIMPDLSRVTKMPKWLEYFGLAQRRARRNK
jgi:hypothetical protein